MPTLVFIRDILQKMPFLTFLESRGFVRQGVGGSGAPHDGEMLRILHSGLRFFLSASMEEWRRRALAKLLQESTGDAEVEHGITAEFEGNHGGLFDPDGVGLGSKDVFDERGKIRFVSDDGDSLKSVVGGKFLERDFRAHSASEPRFYDGLGAAFFGENFGGFLGPQDRTGEENVGNKVVFFEEKTNAMGLFLSLFNEVTHEITSRHSVGIGSGVADQKKCHGFTWSCRHRRQGPGR